MGQKVYASGRFDSKAVVETLESALFLGLPFQIVGTPCEGGEVEVVAVWADDALQTPEERGSR